MDDCGSSVIVGLAYVIRYGKDKVRGLLSAILLLTTGMYDIREECY